MKKLKLVFYFSIFFALLIFPANTFPFNNHSYAASNANLFVSAENSQWNNYFAGPQVIEVIVIDSDINQLDQAYGEPIVTINGKRLRMAQAIDGNWYAYFADRNQAIAAANTALVSGRGLNFGGFCGPNSAQPKAGVDYSDTKGFTIARGGFGSIVHNATFVLTSSAVQNTHCTTGVPATIMPMEHVVRANKTLNQNPLGFAAGSTYGQIWPVIQLYDFSAIPSAVTVDYQKQGGDQIVNLTFDRIPQNLISINVVGLTDAQNSPVLATLNDPQLNIDPTDEDSWSWGSDSAKKALYYQAFDRNGQPDAISVSGAMQNLVGNLTTLMFNHNGRLIIDPKASGERIMDFQSNGIQTIFPSRGDPATVSLSPLVSVSQPITFVEKNGVNTGVFGNWDDKNLSNMVIMDSPIIQGKVTNFTYNDMTVTKTWTYVPNTSEQFHILLKSGSFLPTPGINIASIKNNHQPDDLIHFLIQFPQLPDYNDRSMLSTNHIKLDDYITGNTYVASAKFSDVDNLNNLSKLRWADKFDPEKKLSPNLGLINLDKTPDWAKSHDMITLTIILNEDGNIQEVVDNVTNLLNGTLEAVVPLAPSVTVSFDQNNVGMILNKIAGDDNVQWIDFVDPTLYPANDQARISSGVDTLSKIIPPLGLDGTGVKVFIYDASFVADHPAFGSRLTRDTAIINPPMDTHATHVAGTLGGDGSGSPSPKNLKGMAPGITILSGAFLKSDGLNPTNDNGAEIQNNFTSAINSHVNLASMSLSSNLNAGQVQWLGNYSHTSLLIDKIVSGKLFKPLIFFEAVGNVREWSNPLCSCTATPFEFNSTEPPATAENSIAVGAINSDDYSTTSYTSFGPTSDGRIKPDVMAAGSHNEDVTTWKVDGLASTWFTTNAFGNRIWGYENDHGTSMATPVAAGVGALLIQEWKNTDHGDLFQRLQSNIPPPRTVKALLIHSATDLESPGPDYKTGWGAINATSAIMLVMKNGSNIMNHEGVIHEDIIRGNHENKTYSFTPTNSTNCVKATLVWDDANSTVIASKQLVNNLDLRLEDSSKNIFQPFVLIPNDPTASAKPGNDDINNVEMVVGGPNVGKWTAMVNGTGIAVPPQNYTLIISEIPNPTRGICPAQGVIPPTPDFSISAPVDMINVQAGNSMSVMVNLTPIGGFSGPVSLSTPSLSSGISTTFSPNTLNLGSSPMSSTLTFSTSSGTAPGPYAITILSTSGTITNSAIIHVLVTTPIITPHHVLTIHESVNKGMFGEDLPISAFPVTITDSPGGPVNLTDGNSKILPEGVYHLLVPSPGGFNGQFSSSCSGGVVTLDHDVTCDVENNHCLIATAAFGSELAPEVQFLRDFRDAHLQKTSVGSDFMNVFNQWYYSFSPYVANYENQNPALREIIKDSLYPLLSILVVSEKAFFLIGGNYGTMAAGLIAISMMGAVYVSPMTLSMKGMRTGKLRLKSIFITVSSLLGITIVAILSGNQTVIMISCLLFLLSLMCLTALLTAKMYVCIAKGIDKKLKNLKK